MKKIGLTGTIGSGKSLVAGIFSHLGVPVYHADLRARALMETPEITERLASDFGKEIITASGIPDRKKLAEVVFSSPEKLALLNSIIHPLVKSDFESWCLDHQQHRYILHEAAILFESGFAGYFDKIITVYAPEELCIERVMERDKMSREEVLKRMSHQWPASEKVRLAHFVIVNDEHQFLITQVLKLHELFSAV